MEIAYYKHIKQRAPETWSVENYVGAVKFGQNQDCVISARKEYQKNGKSKLYSKIKSESMLVYPNGTFKEGQAKTNKNIIPNGIVCIDIDTGVTPEVVHQIKNDEYTFIAHESFKGATGLCVWVKINPDRLQDAYLQISKYYFEKYNISTDQACSNAARGRFLSYDPNIYENPKSKKFNVKVEKKEKKIQNYLHTDDSFDYVLSQIRDRNIDLCQEDYTTYIRLAQSISSHFGESGLDKFKFICQFGNKYNERKAEEDYKGCCRANEKFSIATFYYYAKQQGLELYTPKTKEIVNRVKIAKSQGNPTVQSIKDNTEIQGYEVSEDDEKLIEQLINSKEDFSFLINEDLTDLQILGNYIRDVFAPVRDEIKKEVYVNGEMLDDSFTADIVLNCEENLKDITVTERNVDLILKSYKYVRTENALKDFLLEYKDIETNNAIERVVECIETTEDVDRNYVLWAFKRWLVSGLHNWTAQKNDPIVSPLTLVLCSSRMGSGKTFFFRKLIPEQIQKYYLEEKLNSIDKDTRMRLAKNIILLDDEFGGQSVKDNEQFKAITDYNTYIERKAYGKRDDVYKRRALLCGTSNKYNLLKDFSGKNRRILPINIKSVNHEMYDKIDKKELIIEAYNLLKSGFDWKIYKEEDVDYLYSNTQDNIDELPIEDIFLKYFKFNPEGEYVNKIVMNQGELLEFFKRYTVFREITKYNIKEILDKNGHYQIKTIWDEKLQKSRKGYAFYTMLSSQYDFPLDVPAPKIFPEITSGPPF